MYRLLWHFLSVGSLISFFIFIYTLILYFIKNKLNIKKWRLLCFVPLIISIIHYIVCYVPHRYTINLYMFMYLYSIFVAIWQFLSNKEKAFKISSILVIILGFVSFALTFYNTLLEENVHYLTRYNYTDSFNKTIKILKKEYVLNEHKKINYDYLYNKYYPLIEQAEKNKDEQLYLKTMFEFTKNFKDGHFYFGVYYTNLEETTKKYNFMNDYQNKNYGFASILLSNNKIAAILVDKDSEAYQKGLKDGMIITKKDNKKVNDLLNEIITPLSGYPVLEDERLINSFYLFATGGDTISVSFINAENTETTIEIHSVAKENTKPDELYNKIMYYPNLENLDTKMLDDNTGYIYISHEMYSPFKGAIGYLLDDSSYLTKVVEQKLEKLKSKGMKNLIIDLRANGGGFLTESEAIASLFTTDNYLVTKSAKYNSTLYDKTYLKGLGKYKDLEVVVLVNSDTVSAGDCLTYLFSKIPNAKIIGFTNSNNSAQSVGGLIFLSGGTSYIAYPIYKSYDKDNKIFIDTDSSGKANIKLDYRVPINQQNIIEIVNNEENYDYLLKYALKNMD